MATTVTILGATGYVGVQLVSRLADRGYHIKALTRHKCRHNKLGVLSNVQLVETDTHDQAALEKHLAGSAAVINLIGILNQEGASTHTFDNAHVELVKKMVNACLNTGVPRYLHMSALNADAERGSSEYLKSKGKGEDLAFELAGDKLAVTSFRPSVIFGSQDSFFNRFAGLLKTLPVFPLACGDSKMAPVYVGDVCEKIIQALEDPSTAGQRIDLVGPKDYTLRELVAYTGRVSGAQKKIIDLPDWAARLQAKLMALVPGKPFTMDNYLSLQTDSISDDETARQPTSIEAIVPRYIGQKDRNLKYQTFRQAARRD
ncbi:MAG: complex I NDUFA9 subunit family protein [Gammaproteobacteria bacterium]|nr:complex I NDUFA9 subunit family protein [Gammaproteobacteria bacterium]